MSITRKELETYRKIRKGVELSVSRTKMIIDAGYKKRYDRILNILINFENEGLYRVKGIRTLATMAEGICNVLDYETREEAQEPSTDAAEPPLAEL